MADKKDLQVVLSLLDKATAPLNAFNKRIEDVQAPLRTLNNKLSMLGNAAGLGRLTTGFNNVRRAAGNVIGEVTRLGGMLGLAGGGALFAFKKAFVDVAGEFERFETVLGTIEGSSEAAKKAMDWISDFATKTPYELTEVTEAFVKLRAYGMDPTQGLLMSLGDTSAAMGKPLMQAVEAIADAVTGENERLKEFGIRASKVGDKIVYEYSANGKTIRAAAKAGNRAQIQATLEAIWNQKYSGAMDKLSGTWEGTIAKISDHWVQFANMVMKSGPFELLKERVNGLLNEIDAMADDGRLQAIADDWGRKITYAFERIYDVVTKVYNFFVRFVDMVGGVENALMVVAGVISGPLILSLLALGKALAGMGVVLLTTPIGWFLAGVAAIAGAAYLIYDNWEPISAWFRRMWEGIKPIVDPIWNWIKELLAWNPLVLIVQNWEPISAWLRDLWEGIKPHIETVWNWIKNLLSWHPLALIAQNWGPITAWFRDLWEGIRPIIEPVWKWVKDLLSWNPLTLIVQHWEPIRDWFKELWADITQLFDKGVEKVKNTLSSINPVNAVSNAWGSAKSFFGFGDEEDASGQASAAAGIGLGAPAGAAAAARESQAAAGAIAITTNTNNAKVEIDFKNVPRGTQITPARNNTAPLDLSMGYAMATPL